MKNNDFRHKEGFLQTKSKSALRAIRKPAMTGRFISTGEREHASFAKQTEKNLSPFTFHFSRKGKRVAFTLAEVLITLGIIGIVAALTLPSVINKYRAKVLQTSFKKCLSNLYQAYDLTRLQLGIDDVYQTYNVNINTDADFSEFKTTLESNLKLLKVYNRYYDVINYNNTRVINTSDKSDYPRTNKIYADGCSYYLYSGGDGNTSGIHIFMDTNGPLKKPNRYGFDIFKFDIYKDNKIVPPVTIIYTEEELENEKYPELAGNPCSVKSKQGANGAGCAHYAIINVNPDDNTKKYWDSLPK